MRKATVSSLLAALALTACATEGPEPYIDTEGDSDDRLSDYDFTTRISEIVELTETEVDGVVEVQDAQRPKGSKKEHLYITGPLYVLGMPAAGTMELSVDEDGWIDQAANDLQFMLLYEKDDGAWAPVTIFAEYERDGVPTLSKVDRFDAITYSPAEDKLVVENGALDDEVVVEGAELDNRSHLYQQKRLGMFAVPASSWFGIRGETDFSLSASCDGELCVTATREPQDPKEPQEPKDPPSIGDQPRDDVGLHGEVDQDLVGYR